MPIVLAALLEKVFPPENRLVGSGLLHYNSILFVAGPPKTYKSFVVSGAAMQLASGLPLFGATRRGKHGEELDVFPVAKPCRVLMIEQEVGEQDMQERLGRMVAPYHPMAARYARENLYIHSCDHSLALDHPDGIRNLEAIIKDLRPDVLILDPLKEFHHLDENSAQDMGRVMEPIGRLREKYGMATIITHHTHKPRQHDATEGPDRMRGSSYLFGHGDAFLMLRRVTRKGLGESASNRLGVDVTLRRGKPLGDFYLNMDPKTCCPIFGGWAEGRRPEDPGGDE